MCFFMCSNLFSGQKAFPKSTKYLARISLQHLRQTSRSCLVIRKLSRRPIQVEKQDLSRELKLAFQLWLVLYELSNCHEAIELTITAAGWCSKRWWRSHADHQSRCFSREVLPACKTPWRNFCQSRRMIYLSRRQELSRAGSKNLINGEKFCTIT